MSNSMGAAFRSIRDNDCYVFVKEKYVVVNYAPGGKKKDIIFGPTNIVDGFPMFAETLFQHEIDCSFVNFPVDETWFFSKDQCVKTNYFPILSPITDARFFLGPVPINAMFPCLKGTVFENGIDAVMNSSVVDSVWLFKGDELGALQFKANIILEIGKISKSRLFKPFFGTVFEGGIDAAFNTHAEHEVYVFKGQYYAHYDIKKCQFLNGHVKLISDDWTVLQSIL